MKIIKLWKAETLEDAMRARRVGDGKKAVGGGSEMRRRRATRYKYARNSPIRANQCGQCASLCLNTTPFPARASKAIAIGTWTALNSNLHAAHNGGVEQ